MSVPGRAHSIPVILAVVLALPGCGSGYRDRVEVLDSTFEKELTVQGIERPYKSLSSSSYYLRSFVHKTDLTAVHQVYAQGYSASYWYAASGDDADTLDFVCIGSHCRKAFNFAANIQEDKLRSRRQTGYGVKFYSRSGVTQVLHLTPEQIDAQLDAVDAVRARLTSGRTTTAR